MRCKTTDLRMCSLHVTQVPHMTSAKVQQAAAPRPRSSCAGNIQPSPAPSAEAMSPERVPRGRPYASRQGCTRHTGPGGHGHCSRWDTPATGGRMWPVPLSCCRPLAVAPAAAAAVEFLPDERPPPFMLPPCELRWAAAFCRYWRRLSAVVSCSFGDSVMAGAWSAGGGGGSGGVPRSAARPAAFTAPSGATADSCLSAGKSCKAFSSSVRTSDGAASSSSSSSSRQWWRSQWWAWW